MYKCIAMGALLLQSTYSLAAPTVSGNTISWPDDGWYQVQNADTFESICEGGLSCDVPNGSYIVINHTTGERFTDTNVGSSPSSIVVLGNTISWPDDGWYQVQNADTFESICEGGLSCDVPNASYIVINHTTGERFTDTNVGSSPSPIVVLGNTISWPDDGWYQVQNADTFETLCEGGPSCDVVPGVYTVINHTTGQRFEHNRIGDSSHESGLPQHVATRLTQIVEIVNGSTINEAAQLSLRMVDIYNAGFGDPFTVTDSSFGGLFGERNYVADCSGGGAAQGSVIRTTDPDEESFSFSNCQIGNRSFNGRAIGRIRYLENTRSSYTYGDEGIEIGNTSTNTLITYGNILFIVQSDGTYELRSRTAEGTAISVERSNNGYQIQTINTQTSNEVDVLADGSPGFTSSFNVILETGADATNVTTVEPFDIRSDSGASGVGELRIDGPNYQYHLLADNGDVATFQLTVTENGISTAYTIEWGTPFLIQPIHPANIELGF